MPSEKITLTAQEQRFVKENYERMSTLQMSRILKMSYIKVNQNLRAMRMKSPFSNKCKSLVMAEDQDGFWNDRLHHKYFIY